MLPRRRFRAPTLVAAAVLAVGVLAGCGDDEEAHHEPFREGLAEEAGGVFYDVFLTRQLNLRIDPDRDYYRGPEAPPGSALYGVFMQACNPEKEGPELQAARHITVRDSAGQEFEPLELPESNVFAYRPLRLAPGECIPADGSLADESPIAGAMLLFQLPLQATENRPLLLEIEPSSSLLDRERKPLEIELDI